MKGIKKTFKETASKFKEPKTWLTIGYFTCASTCMATSLAFADGGTGLTQIKELLANGAMFLGGVIAAWGGIQLGMNLRESGGGGGGQLSGAIGWIVGGGVIFAAALVLKGLNPGF